MDRRHKQRLQIVQDLFAREFNTAHKATKTTKKKTEHIIAAVSKVDPIIEKFAGKYPLEKIAKIDLAILRLSVYDLIITPSTPPKVVINEAVELARELGGEQSYAFINGVLGNVIKMNHEANH